MTTKVTILGGAGSIGSALARSLCMKYRVTVLDHNEEAVWSLCADEGSITGIVGDASSPHGDLYDVIDSADHIVNCAALKHVDMCERFPKISERWNVGIAELLAEYRRPSILLSTDKAIKPISIMGVHKSRAEWITRSVGGKVVRFGNVLGSRGSIVPSVVRCARENRPIRMTDPDMTRFFMTIDEAVQTLKRAMTDDTDADTFYPEHLRSARIGDFLEICRDTFAPGVEIQKVGPRPGERKHEYMNWNGELVTSDDERFAMSDGDIYWLLDELKLDPMGVAA